jgi:hypothetical protein
VSDLRVYAKSYTEDTSLAGRVHIGGFANGLQFAGSISPDDADKFALELLKAAAEARIITKTDLATEITTETKHINTAPYV